jgi:hypothetical protein
MSSRGGEAGILCEISMAPCLCGKPSPPKGEKSSKTITINLTEGRGIESFLYFQKTQSVMHVFTHSDSTPKRDGFFYVYVTNRCEARVYDPATATWSVPDPAEPYERETRPSEQVRFLLSGLFQQGSKIYPRMALNGSPETNPGF